MKTKKFLSVVLSAAMILGVAVPVAAEPVAAEQSVETEQQPIVENSITSGYIPSDLDYNTPVYEPMMRYLILMIGGILQMKL